MKKLSLIKSIAILSAPVVIAAVLLVFFQTNEKLQFNAFVNYGIILGAVAVFVVYYYRIYSDLRKNINKHIVQIDKISGGEINGVETIDNSYLLPVDLINKSINKLVGSLNNTLQHIIDITSGNLDKEYKLAGDNDIIGKELVKLEDALKKDKAELEKNKLEEQQRNWVANGLAKFSDILRQDTHDISKMGYGIVSNLVDYVDLNQGGLFVLQEEDEDSGEDVYYEMVSAVAYDRKKVIHDKIKIGESLVGRCAFEKKTIYMSNVPNDYINITSGLGTSNPGNLLLVPCVLEEKVLAIIELASFSIIEKYQIEFIERLGESIASSISNVKTNERTATLLNASKNQSEELAAQEEELRQNLEEMEATQDELQRQMKMNNEMQVNLRKEKFLFDSFLEHSPVRVNFKDKDTKFMKASRSLLEKFGKSSYEQIEGMTEFDFASAEYAKRATDDDMEIMRTRIPKINVVEYEMKTDGSEIWKNVSKIPLVNDDEECLGVMAIVYDLTESKLNEFENNRLKNTNSNYHKLLLSAGNVLFMNKSGLVTEANDGLCDLFGLKGSDVKGKQISDVFKVKNGVDLADLIEKIIKEGSIEGSDIFTTDTKKTKVKQQLVANEIAKGEYEIVMICSDVK